MSKQNFAIVATVMLILFGIQGAVLLVEVHRDTDHECDCADPITDGCITICTGDIDPADPLMEYEYYEHPADY